MSGLGKDHIARFHAIALQVRRTGDARIAGNPEVKAVVAEGAMIAEHLAADALVELTDRHDRTLTTINEEQSAKVDQILALRARVAELEQIVKDAEAAGFTPVKTPV